MEISKYIYRVDYFFVVFRSIIYLLIIDKFGTQVPQHSELNTAAPSSVDFPSSEMKNHFIIHSQIFIIT